MGKKEKLLPPPLLLTSHGEESVQHSVYNLLENRYRTTQIPVLRNKSVLGSAYGWLFLLDQTLDTDSEGECCLWNPTSMEIIQLQRLEDSATYIKCVLSKSPTEPGCFIVFTQNCSLGQTVYRIGDNTGFKVSPEDEGYGYNVHAIVSFQGVIYGLVEPGYEFDYEFVTFHVAGDKLEARPLWIDEKSNWEISDPAQGAWCTMNEHYFMESPCGSELLLVTKTIVDCYIESGVHFRVFRVDVGGKELEELDNLDGRTIFIANHGNGFCRSSESFGSKIKSNCVYYTNSIGMVIYVYDFDDRSTIALQPYSDSADIDPLTSINYWIDLPEILKSSDYSESMITPYLPRTIVMQPYPDAADIDPLTSKNYWVDLPEILKSSGSSSSMINWGEFDGNLLNLILRNLFGKDRLSFSLVCRHWNSVAANSPYRYSPCLMYYHRRTCTWRFYQYNSFFNTTFPELENAEICCSKYGWLLMMTQHDGTLFFFDPSNNQTIELPHHPHCVFTSLCFFNPPTSPECVVVGIRTPISKRDAEICTLKRGEDEWESMDRPISFDGGSEFCVSLGAPVLHCGMVYYLSGCGDVAILDIKKRSLDVHFECLGYDVDELVIKDQYLVKVNGEEDELFSVFVFWEERKVNVFRLSSKMKWDSVESIGDKVFYVSHTSSFGVKAPIKSMENTICFPEFRGDVAVFYSLSDAKYHSLDGGFSEGNVYGLKRFHSATWVMPMPAQEVMATISSPWLS